MMVSETFTIAIIGGTGRMGQGLAVLFARAGHRVLIGSRNEEKAALVVEGLKKKFGRLHISSHDEKDALILAEVVVISVPFAAHKETIHRLKTLISAKLVIDITVPLDAKNRTKLVMPIQGSAGLETQTILGSGASVVDAFQHISYKLLTSGPIEGTEILVCGSPNHARNFAMQLIRSTGFIPIDAGGLENSPTIEGFTPILIHMNKVYKKDNLTIKIQGLCDGTSS